MAPASPSSAASHDQHLGAGRERRQNRGDTKDGGTDQEETPPPDPVSQGAHGDQGRGNQEAVDIENPEQLSAAGLEVGADRRDSQIEDREVHGVEQAGQGDDRQANPLAPPRLHCPPLTISITAASAQTTPVTCQVLSRSRRMIRANSTVLAG